MTIATGELPKRTRTYRFHHFDSTRWDDLQVRDDDILICTSMKSGTTWMQRIVALLIFQEHQPERSFHDISHWVDMRLPPIDKVLADLDAQTHRRFMKTHTALDGLTYHPQMKYIVVGRDVRDAFMSLWNHTSNYTPEFIAALNGTPGLVGEPFPPLYDDIHALWKDWINKGNFPWESDGYPFWSHLHFIQSWWDYRHLPNIYLVHFNDLSRDLDSEMRKIAGFLDIEVPERLWPVLVEQASFETMKANAEQLLPTIGRVFAGGAQSFIHKGTNGRWREVLSEAELRECDAAIARTLSPDCAHWLEHGGPV